MKTLPSYPDTMTQTEKRAAYRNRPNNGGFNEFLLYGIAATVKATGERVKIQNIYRTDKGLKVFLSKGSDGFLNDLKIDESELEDFERLVAEVQ